MVVAFSVVGVEEVAVEVGVGVLVLLLLVDPVEALPLRVLVGLVRMLQGVGWLLALE